MQVANFHELLVRGSENQPISLTLHALIRKIQGVIFSIFLFSSVPPVITVTHSEEEQDINVEEGTQKEEDSELKHNSDVEPSTSVEQTKEVRHSAYIGHLPLSVLEDLPDVERNRAVPTSVLCRCCLLLHPHGRAGGQLDKSRHL